MEVHADLFKSFKEVHDNFGLDTKKYRDKFNEEGQDLLRIIQKWENSLCSKSESGKYGKFSTSLSEKFRAEIKLLFPHIERVGELD